MNGRSVQPVRFDQLAHEVTERLGLPEAELAGAGAARVRAVHHDSRRVEPGSLFCCVRGDHADGHRFAADAVAAGATALLVDHRLPVDVAQLVVPSVRSAMGPAAATVYGHPSRSLEVIGVTGTNGKTTTTHLLRSILEASGRSTGLIGTLSGARTTPEAPELQRSLAMALAEGRDAVAMEVSSHALALERVDGTRFAVAVFTNLSRDHLDFHHDMATYFRAKARLFTPQLSERAAVNLDDPHGRLLRDAASIPTVGFALSEVDDLRLDARGAWFRWRGATIELALTGSFNVANALAAATAAELAGVELDAIVAGLGAAAVVPGRFELVERGQPFTVAVDYAHTPDGLTQVLTAARQLAAGHRVHVVFGAGGERDRAKRPLMGEAACRGADRVVLTSDNPRGENPARILDEVRAGMSCSGTLTVEPDRRTAIFEAVAAAGPGDVVVVAGKGHETTQVIGDIAAPFDDRLVVAEALAAEGWP